MEKVLGSIPSFSTFLFVSLHETFTMVSFFLSLLALTSQADPLSRSRATPGPYSHVCVVTLCNGWSMGGWVNSDENSGRGGGGSMPGEPGTAVFDTTS